MPSQYIKKDQENQVRDSQEKRLSPTAVKVLKAFKGIKSITDEELSDALGISRTTAWKELKNDTNS